VGQQTGKPPLSDDGRFWWDGAAWQPLYSPDGAHRWDGARWVPVAAPTGDLPAWLPAESASALHGPPEISGSEIPAQPVAALTAPSGPPARPWITWGARAVVVGVLGVVVFALHNQYPNGLPFFGGGGSTTVTIGGRATPDPSLSQYDRADRLLNLQLAPQLVEAGNAEQAIAKDCATPVSQPCRVALNDTYHKLDAVIQTMDKSDIPPCIQDPLQKFRNTLNTAELQLAQAVQALDRSDGAGEAAFIHAFATAVVGSQADTQAVQTAFAACSKAPPPGARPKPTGSS
jgi:hypothetical protein